MINKNELLLDEFMKIKLNGKNRKHYLELGYVIEDGQRELTVRTIDIPKNSEILVRIKCQKCGKESKTTWYNFNRYKKVLCEECSPYRGKTLFCQFCGEETHRKHSNGLGICDKHRYQIARHGHIIQGKYDKNEYIFENNYIKIILQSNGKILEDYAIIDIDDYDKVKDYRWHLEKSRGDLKYVADCSGGKTKRLHNIIMGVYDDKVIDHINGNGLDNRKQNLRIATFSENGLNSKSRGGKLGLKNIIQQSKNSYRVQIKIDGNTIAKSFNTLEDAIRYRDDFYKENNIISRHYEED